MYNKVILNHTMVKIFEENQTYIVAIRMRDGKYALQMPFPADQRGIVGAMTLAVDVLAGKVMLDTVVDLNAPTIERTALPGDTLNKQFSKLALK